MNNQYINNQTPGNKKFNSVDHDDNINDISRNNNSYMKSFSLIKEINDKTYNNSKISEKKKMIPSNKFNFRKNISLKKSQLNNFRNYLFDKSINEQKDIKKKSPVLLLNPNFEENKDNDNNISFQSKIPKKIGIKNPLFDIDNNKVNKTTDIDINLRKRIKSGKVFLNFGGNFLSKNKYISDFMNSEMNKSEENNKIDKKDWENIEEKENENIKKGIGDMEYKDMKIEKLAKDLKLFQNNDEHFKYLPLKKNYSYANLINNLKLPDENVSYFENINISRNNNLNENISPISRISTRTPSSRIYSGKMINYNNININRLNFDKYKINNILNNSINNNISNLSQQNNEYEYYIEGTNILSPFCEKARDLFLYKKIFFYFGHKKVPKIMKRFLNNKLNLCYAENEEQFDNHISKQNMERREKGVGKILKVGKTEQEKKAEDICHKVGFIKKVFDYAYPDILIYRIKHKSKMHKNDIKEIKENNLKNLLKNQQLNNDKEKKMILKKIKLLNSIKIEKINL